MIASAKNYTHTHTHTQTRTDRTLGQMVKSKLYRQNHIKKHTHTQSQKEKKEKNIYIFWEVWGLLPAFSRCSVGVFPHVDVFLMYLWGGRWAPCLTPPPSWRSPLIHHFLLVTSLSGKKTFYLPVGVCYLYRAWKLLLLVSQLYLIEVSVY